MGTLARLDGIAARAVRGAVFTLAMIAALARPAPAAVSVGGWMAHSPDDLPGGFATLLGNDVTTTVVLPFTFTVEGVNYTQIVLSSNGWIEFGSNTSGD